jgi:hypothetical protein
MGHFYNENDRETPKCMEKNLSITNPTWTDMGLNQSLHRVRNEQPTVLFMA